MASFLYLMSALIYSMSSSLKKSIVFLKYGLKLNLAKGERFDVYWTWEFESDDHEWRGIGQRYNEEGNEALHCCHSAYRKTLLRVAVVPRRVAVGKRTSGRCSAQIAIITIPSFFRQKSASPNGKAV